MTFNGSFVVSRSKNGVASLAYAIPLGDALCLPSRDARHEAGHDGGAGGEWSPV
jgi:hypothetical protein